MITIIHKMANKLSAGMFSLNIVLVFISVVCGELYVTHTPTHVQFLEATQTLKLSELPDVISSAFGFEIEHELSWDGLGAGDLFKRPKANVLVSIETPSDVAISHITKYNTEEDVSGVDTDSIAYNIYNLVKEGETPLVMDMSHQDKVMEIRSNHPELFSDVPTSADELREVMRTGQGLFSSSQLGSLNASHVSDLNLVGELQIIQSIVNSLESKGLSIHGRLPNFFHFKISALQAVSNTHGANSQQVADAHKLVDTFIAQLTKLLRAIYKDNLIVEVLTLSQPESPSRIARHLLQNPTTAPEDANLNLAAAYDPMYPVTFNIILWLMITLVISLIGISYGIWFMDPGRDSIIYRMTSTRIKKD